MDQESSSVPYTWSVQEAESDPLMGQDGGSVEEGVELAVISHKYRIFIQSLGNSVRQGVEKRVEWTRARKVQKRLQSLAKAYIFPNFFRLPTGLVWILGISSVLTGIVAEVLKFLQFCDIIHHRDRSSNPSYLGTSMIVVGAVYVLAATVDWNCQDTSDGTQDAKVLSLEIVAGGTQPNVILLRSLIDLILRDCSRFSFNMMSCLGAFYIFPSAVKERYINKIKDSYTTVFEWAVVGAAICAIIFRSLIYFLHRNDNTKGVADKPILSEVVEHEVEPTKEA